MVEDHTLFLYVVPIPVPELPCFINGGIEDSHEYS